MIMRLVDLFPDFIAALNGFHFESDRFQQKKKQTKQNKKWKKGKTKTKLFYDYIGINYHPASISTAELKFKLISRWGKLICRFASTWQCVALWK